jgi:hypothetical protein
MLSLDVVRAVAAALAERSIRVALGGSGLLAALGLADQVRDWDLTTDSEPADVAEALAAAGIAWSRVSSGEGQYATRARLCVDAGDHQVDVIIGFAVRDTGGRIQQLPASVTGSWEGLPLGDPRVWATAYRLLGRTDRAATLDRWLAARR